MPSNAENLIGIAILAVVTYLTRIAGYVLGKRIREGSRLFRVIQSLPGCALSAVVAPAFIQGTWLERAAIGIASLVFVLTHQILAGLVAGLAVSIAGVHWLG